MNPEPEAVQHEHEMIGEFTREITGIYRYIKFIPDLFHDFFRERINPFAQFYFLYRTEIYRSAHAHDRKKGKELFLDRKINMKNTSNLIDQTVNFHELTDCRQIVIRISELPYKMTCEKSVYHKEKIPFKLYADLLLKRLAFYIFFNQCPDILVQRIVRI